MNARRCHKINLFLLLQVSYASTCNCLSDKSRFPSFLRTTPSAYHSVRAIVWMVQHFGWLFVGSIAVDDDFGRTGQVQFVEEAEQGGMCIAFQEFLPRVEDANEMQYLGKQIF